MLFRILFIVSMSSKDNKQPFEFILLYSASREKISLTKEGEPPAINMYIPEYVSQAPWYVEQGNVGISEFRLIQ